MLEELKRERDELQVSIHLAKAEAGNEWASVEKKWQHFKTKSDQIGREAKASSKEVADSGMRLLKDIRDGYRRIRKLI